MWIGAGQFGISYKLLLRLSMGEGKTWAAHSELHFIEHLRFFVLMICGHGLRLRFSTSGHVSNYIYIIF